MSNSVGPYSGRSGGKLSRRARFGAIVSLFGSLGVLLAACSSGSANASGSSTSTTSGGSTAASFTAYENCLKSHGVNFSGSGFRLGGGFGAPSGSSTTRPTFTPAEKTELQKASAASASLRPSFNRGGATGSAFAAYRNCLKLHGVTLPTGRGFGGFGAGGSSTSTTTNPKLKAAMAACAPLRPKGGFGGGFPGASTSTTS